MGIGFLRPRFEIERVDRRDSKHARRRSSRGKSLGPATYTRVPHDMVLRHVRATRVATDRTSRARPATGGGIISGARVVTSRTIRPIAKIFPQSPRRPEHPRIQGHFTRPPPSLK